MQDVLEQLELRRSLLWMWDRAEASTIDMRFRKGFKPWLNDRYHCRVPILANLHVVVDSNFNEWESTK